MPGPTVVQHKFAQTANASTPITLTSAPTAGNALWAFVSCQNGTSVTWTPPAGYGFTQLGTTQQFSTTRTITGALFRANNLSAGLSASMTWQVSGGSPVDLGVDIYEVTGQDLRADYADFFFTGQSANVTSVTGNVNVPRASGLVLGFFACGFTRTVTAGSGFTLDEDGAVNFASQMSVESKATVSIGSQAVGFTLNSVASEPMIYGGVALVGPGTTATFTANGTGNWLCPANISSVTAECIGGGGGGAGGTSAAGGGGGYAKKNTIAVTPGTTYHPAVGAGGSAGTDGGDSSFTGDSAQTCVGKGGKGSTNGGTGGTGSTGDVTHDGGAGSTSTTSAGGGAGGATGAGGNAVTTTPGAAGTGALADGSTAGAGGASGANGGTYGGGAGHGNAPSGSNGIVVLSWVSGDATIAIGSIAISQMPQAPAASGTTNAVLSSIAVSESPQALTAASFFGTTIGTIPVLLGLEALPEKYSIGAELPWSPDIRDTLILTPPQLASVTFTTSIQGGFVQATAAFKALLDESAIFPNAHIEVRWNGSLVFEGILKTPKLVGRHVQSIEAAGYAQALLDTNPWNTEAFKVANEPTEPMGLVLARALAQAPLITVGQPWGNPAARITFSELSDRTPWAVAQQLSAAAGFDLLVYEDRIATWQARTAPDVPDYLIAVEDCGDYEPDYLDLFTRITATYTDPVTGVKGRTEQFTNWEAEQRLGVSLAVVQDAGTMSLAAANAWAQTQLRYGVIPTVRATIGPFLNIRDAYGNPIEAPNVRSGQWLQIGGPAPGTTQPGSPEEGRGMLCIISTSCDEQGRVTAQLCERPLSVAGDIGRVKRAVERLAAGTNLNSLGPQ